MLHDRHLTQMSHLRRHYHLECQKRIGVVREQGEKRVFINFPKLTRWKKWFDSIMIKSSHSSIVLQEQHGEEHIAAVILGPEGAQL